MSRGFPPSSDPGRSSLKTEDLFEMQSLAIEDSVHEIRGLLLAGGYAKILLRERAGPLTPLQRDYLAVIVENTSRIKELLDSLSRVADCHQLETSRFQWKDLLDEAMQQSGHRHWVWREPAQCAAVVIGDRKKLHQAMLEIFDSHGWTGDPLLTVRAEKRCVLTVFRGSFVEEQRPLEGQVQCETRMLDPDRDPETKRFARSVDIVRLHGGLLSEQRLGPDDYQVTVRLPATNTSRETDQSHV
jgi:hypothetical protein